MQSLRRMGRFTRSYTWVSFFLVLTVILPVTMELAVPRALGYVIDQGVTKGDMQAILRGSAIMLGLALAGAIATIGQGICRALLSQGLAYDMRNALFNHIQTFSFANLDHLHTGQLITRLSSDVDMVRAFIGNGLALLLRAVLMITGSLTMLFIIDWQLALIVLIIMPLAVGIIWFVLHFASPLFVVVQEKLSGLNTIVQENLSGALLVKAFVREKFEIDRFGEINTDYMERHIKVGQLLATASPILTLLTNLGLVGAIWFGGVSTISGRLSVGELVAFTNYLIIGMAPIMLLGNVLTSISQAEASSDRIWEVLDMQPRVRQAVQPAPMQAMRGEVTFEKVNFHYGGNDGTGLRESSASSEASRWGLDVLSEVSFEVTPGQRIALLGATGSGKTTLVSLIPRFYDSASGQISIDGIDVRQWDLHALRQQIGVVLQQTTLFSGTVAENVAYGRPDADRETIIAATKAAQAHDFVMRMPNGYESMIATRGANLSGGQKQRIAIARALLISPRILILDDSTSAVDMETEAKIQDALERLMENCTTLIIAQRISSVLSADQILILNRGQVVAQGTHQQLLKYNHIYQEIYQSQLGNGSDPGQLGSKLITI